MKKVLLAAVAALAASLAVAVPALAEHGGGWDRVCHGFAVHGKVSAVGERAFEVAVAEARPSGLAGETVELRTGSRTRVDGTLAVGATVKAHGTVCQLDPADDAVFYTRHVKVKKVKVERPRGSFELAGEVVAVGDDSSDVAVDESNVGSLVGKTVRLRLGDRTEVEGDLVVGARAAAKGKARIVGGEAVLLATSVEASGGDAGSGDDEGE
jgi:hypothetical protein